VGKVISVYTIWNEIFLGEEHYSADDFREVIVDHENAENGVFEQKTNPD
jgi:hypothetical protein